MALTGAIFTIVGAVLVLLDAADRWRTASITIDGGNASTDFAAELRKKKRRELAPTVGPALVLVGAILTVVAL